MSGHQDDLDALDQMSARLLTSGGVENRRREWAQVVDTLVPTLEDLVSALPNIHQARRLHVNTPQGFQNFSSIELRFGNQPTGIVDKRIENGRVALASGIERGAGLVFSQGETGHVVAIAYPFSTDLPSSAHQDEPSRLDPWLGPRWEPTDLTESEVITTATDFIKFAVTTSIFWDGEPKVPRRFRRPGYLQSRKTEQNVDEILQLVRRNDPLVVPALTQLLDDMGRLLSNLDARQEADFLDGLQPVPPRLRRLFSNLAGLVTAGLVEPDDLKRR